MRYFLEKMEEFADTFEQKDRYFAHVDDSYFWGDRECVKTLIELYESYPCLWDFRSPEYKVVSKKKLAKVEIGKHSGWSGKQLVSSVNAYTNHKLNANPKPNPK